MSTRSTASQGPLLPSAAGVFLLSAAVLALELALMRCLSIARWHHFAYLVVSTALLGFGASGTLLSFAAGRLRGRFGRNAALISALFAVSITLSIRAAEALPLDARFVLFSGRQAALMFAYHLLLFVPFLLAATAIGLSLVRFEGRAHFVYAASLGGSGAGAAAAMGLMFVMAPVRLMDVASGLGLAAALLFVASGGVRARAVLPVILVGVALAAVEFRWPLELRADPYKALSVMRRWERQGDARHIATRFSPRARLDAYACRAQHQTLFVSLNATALPPPQLALLADGDLAGTVFDIRSPEEARILDWTLSSLAYRLVRTPRVLLLGEVGGVNVWLARRMGARHITVVQPDPQVVALMRGPLAGRGGAVLDGPDVEAVVEEPRVFLERCRDRFDLIQIVTVEGMSAGVSAFRSLQEDFLLTREGLALCVARLRPGGVAEAVRGRQLPPRDNVKMMATFRAALEAAGVREPGRHLVQARDYQAVATLAFRSPVSEEQCRGLTAAADELGLDIEWAPCPGVRYDRQRHRMAGPPGKPYSYFHYAARSILSGDREAFFRRWVYDVRPATDERPYFYDFFRWRSLPVLMRAYGPEWLRRTELGYVVLVFCLAQALVAGAAMILLPLAWLRPARGVSRGRLATGAYFLLLGLGYMMVEMVCLLKFVRFLGDPTYAAGVVLASFLVFSGLGSAASRRLCRSAARAVRAATASVAALLVAYAVGLDGAFSAMIGLPLAVRVAAAVALSAPVAFMMGWPFPNGLALVELREPRLVPWAWGANGFASVAASPLAVLVAIGGGYTAVLLLSCAVYLLAGGVSFALAGGARRTDGGGLRGTGLRP